MPIVERIAERPFAPPAAARFRILAIDGGGIRGLIPAMVLARLERLLVERSGPGNLARAFDLIAGTSTGGLIALGLATPRDGQPAVSAAAMVEIYRGSEARRIFARGPLQRLPLVGRAIDLFRPRYGAEGLADVLADHLGEATLSEALTEVLITAYDMTGRATRFFKRWPAASREIAALDAAIATASAPTYFPAHPLDGRALIDGGVFANDPTVAAIAEAMKRTEDGAIRPDDLLVVSLGTGDHMLGYEPARVSRWGALGWILPKGKAPPPLIDAMLDGQSAATDHWAHMLLNHEPGAPVPPRDELGGGPRYYRYQVPLAEPLPIDGVTERDIARLVDHAEALIAAREAELEALADVLVAS
jgi:uncharacterized protein